MKRRNHVHTYTYNGIEPYYHRDIGYHLFHTWRCKCGKKFQSTLPYKDEYVNAYAEQCEQLLATQPLKE